MRPRDVEAMAFSSGAIGFRRHLNQKNCYFCRYSISYLTVGSTWHCHKWDFTFGDGEHGVENMVEHICDSFKSDDVVMQESSDG